MNSINMKACIIDTTRELLSMDKEKFKDMVDNHIHRFFTEDIAKEIAKGILKYETMAPDSDSIPT